MSTEVLSDGREPAVSGEGGSGGNAPATQLEIALARRAAEGAHPDPQAPVARFNSAW